MLEHRSGLAGFCSESDAQTLLQITTQVDELLLAIKINNDKVILPL